ncbi:MAG: tetratricopeptide repeat protein, partial [Woeseiaceae bacterium]
MKRLYDELRRRNVFRIAAAYLAGAWLIVQLMESLLPIFGYPETSGQPVVIMLVAGFIPALILAWFFQYTPLGLKAQDELDLAADTDPGSNRTFDTVVIVFLLAAISYFVVDKFVLEPARVEVMVETAVEDALTAPIDRTIAVMPFIDLSPEGNQEYFSDGLSEELLNLLAKIPDLKVASRTSSFAFKGTDAQISEIAEALSVGHVLEGSVRMSGNRIRVTAQLIKAADGYHLWSDTFERELDDVLHVQDEIAAQVVEELEVTLVDPAPKTRKTDGRAYSLYLQANYLNQQYTQESMERSVELLQEVL